MGDRFYNLKEDCTFLKDEEAVCVIVDQTRLPGELVYRELTTVNDFYVAIQSLAVRGAPAIGVCAAYAMYVLAARKASNGFGEFREELEEDGNYLISSRPTAVNLAWGVREMLSFADSLCRLPIPRIVEAMREKSELIHRDHIDMNRRIGELGLTLVKPGDGILTHCNAGPLACLRYGTATAPILLGHERGVYFRVFADETRPLLQGARLTAYELDKAGVDVTLICDNMAGLVMKNGWIQAVFVGCDRIAANGDFANKIGTSGVAVLANYYGIPFYTLGPTSTVDFACPTGADIQIELRAPEEIKSKWYTAPMSPASVKCYNPSFDVTDHSLVTAIVTDRGIVYPPFEENLRRLYRRRPSP